MKQMPLGYGHAPFCVGSSSQMGTSRTQVDSNRYPTELRMPYCRRAPKVLILLDALFVPLLLVNNRSYVS